MELMYFGSILGALAYAINPNMFAVCYGLSSYWYIGKIIGEGRVSTGSAIGNFILFWLSPFIVAYMAVTAVFYASRQS